MKTFKRALCLLLALCLCAGLFTGCGKTTAQQAPELHVYASKDVDTGIEEYADGFGDIVIAGDWLYSVGNDYDADYPESTFLLRIKPDGTEVQKLPLEMREFDPDTGWGNIQRLLTDDAGTLYAIEYLSTSGGEGDDFTYTEQFFINRLAEDGSVVSSFELEIPEGVWPDAYSAIWAGGGFLIPVDTALLHVTADGKSRTVEVLPDGNGYINRMFPMADGRVLILYYGGEDWTSHLAYLDLTAGKLGEELPAPAALGSGTLVSDADGKMYSYDQTGIYAIDLATGTDTLLCSWLDSDIDYNTISDLRPMTDGSFLAVSRGDSWDKMILSTLTYVDPATLPEKTVLTLACSYSWDMQRAALAFNRTSDTVRITLKDYSKYNNQDNEWTGAVTQMNTDIITGNIPDLLLVDSTLPFQNYVAKGLFTDLYPLLDADETLSREDLVTSVLKACETDGKLTSIIPSYSIVTMVGPAAVVGEKAGWTWEEFFTVLKQYPEADPAIAYMGRRDLLTLALMMNNGDFVDQATGKCSFDSESFISLLEYAATYPEEFDYDSMTGSEKDLFAQGKLLLSQAWLSELGSIRDYVYTMNGPITFKGFPTSDGSVGSAFTPNIQLAIAEACPDKEAAWEFVRYFLSDEYQIESDQLAWAMPLRTAALDKKIEEALTPREDDGDFIVGMPAPDAKTYTAESETVSTETVVTDNGIADMLPEDDWVDEDDYWNRALTQAEVDQMVELINSTTTLYRYDEALLDIVLEEAEAFFAGTRTAAEAAAILQNRAQTYISESR